MAILIEKLVRFFKSPFRQLDHTSPSLRGFRSKTLFFLSQVGEEDGSKITPMTWFNNCFEVMHAANDAFAELLEEMDYPMSQWGAVAMHDYLGYTLRLMDMLNSITSSAAHLSMLMMPVRHGLSPVEYSPNSEAKYLHKIWTDDLASSLKVEMSPGIYIKPGSDQKERVILEALMLMKKIGFLSLSFVATAICSDAEPFLEMGSDDPLKKAVIESSLCRDVPKIQSYVEEVNRATTTSGKGDEEDVEALKEKMEVMKNAIQGIKQQANGLFSEVVAARNKVMNNIRA